MRLTGDGNQRRRQTLVRNPAGGRNENSRVVLNWSVPAGRLSASRRPYGDRDQITQALHPCVKRQTDRPSECLGGWLSIGHNKKRVSPASD